MPKKTTGELVIAVEKKEEGPKEPTARIFLPELEGDGSEGLVVDQYEHVSISNEVGDNFTRIHRGEWIDVPWNVFEQLKNRYPKL